MTTPPTTTPDGEHGKPTDAETEAAREIAIWVARRDDNRSEHDTGTYAPIIAKHFAPLRAELKRTKEGLEQWKSAAEIIINKENTQIANLSLSLNEINAELQAVKARSAMLEKVFERNESIDKQHQEWVAKLQTAHQQATKRIEELESDVAQAHHNEDRLGEDLRKRVDAYLNERHCCTGQECGCMGITRLEQAIAEEAGSRITQLRSDLATARTELEGRRKDSEGLDWLLKYITNKGINGLRKLVWSVYDEEGKLLNHRATITEDEVGEIRFDRPAIAAARSALSGKGGEA